MSPYEIPSLAGEPYRPSNGSEGMMFEESFCVRCKHDATFWKTQLADDGCKIHLAALVYETKDKEYPPEWTHDFLGRPTCTAFEEAEE